MPKIADYDGNLLSHMQGFYRQGDHGLAVELMEAIGLAVAEVETSPGHSLTRVHLNPGDRNAVDNVMYLSAMMPHQEKVEAVLQDRMATDAELNDAVTQYRDVARAHGDASSHFGVHFPTHADVDRALDNLSNRVSPELARRITIKEMPAYGAVADFPDMRQVFIHTDVFAFGSTTLGQTIELQVERAV